MCVLKSFPFHTPTKTSNDSQEMGSESWKEWLLRLRRTTRPGFNIWICFMLTETPSWFRNVHMLHELVRVRKVVTRSLPRSLLVYDTCRHIRTKRHAVIWYELACTHKKRSEISREKRFFGLVTRPVRRTFHGWPCPSCPSSHSSFLHTTFSKERGDVQNWKSFF